MFDDFREEREIHRVLVQLSRQRVAVYSRPGDIWVLDGAVDDSPETDAALRTCHMRGWIEIIRVMPSGRLDAYDGTLPANITPTGDKPLYRLTEAGWNQIRRTHAWVIATFLVSLAALAGTAWQLLLENR